jgi:predicted amidohydrolase
MRANTDRILSMIDSACLIGPQGLIYKYRKVNTWIPYEVHTSPHDLEGYQEPLFPVADTPMGRIGCAICYDWLFPEALRQLAANGAEVLVRVSAYMDVGRNRADGLVDHHQPRPRN